MSPKFKSEYKQTSVDKFFKKRILTTGRLKHDHLWLINVELPRFSSSYTHKVGSVTSWSRLITPVVSCDIRCLVSLSIELKTNIVYIWSCLLL